MKIGSVRFATPVEFSSSHSRDDCFKALSVLVGMKGAARSAHPFVGRISKECGWLKQRATMFTVMPVRRLEYRLRVVEQGTLFSGELVLIPIVRVPIGLYLVCAIAMFLYGIIQALLHRQGDIDLIASLIGFGMIFAWTLLAIWLNRRSERQMVRSVEFALNNPEQAQIAAHLLA